MAVCRKTLKDANASSFLVIVAGPGSLALARGPWGSARGSSQREALIGGIKIDSLYPYSFIFIFVGVVHLNLAEMFKGTWPAS